MRLSSDNLNLLWYNLDSLWIKMWWNNHQCQIFESHVRLLTRSLSCVSHNLLYWKIKSFTDSFHTFSSCHFSRCASLQVCSSRCLILLLLVTYPYPSCLWLRAGAEKRGATITAVNSTIFSLFTNSSCNKSVADFSRTCSLLVPRSRISQGPAQGHTKPR